MKQQQNIHPSSQEQTVNHMSGRFKQKLEAENKAVTHQKKMKEREKLRQEKVVQEKRTAQSLYQTCLWFRPVRNHSGPLPGRH